MELLVSIVIPFVIAAGGTRLAMMLAARLHFLDRPGAEAHKQHAAAVPYGGGLAMALAVAAGMVACRQFPSSLLGDLDLDHARLWPIYLGAAVLLVIGMIDDRRPLKAVHKLIAQAVIAAVVIPAADLPIDSLHQWPWLAFLVTWGWMVLVTNAFNLLDHADGLAASVAVVSIAVLLGGAVLDNDVRQASLYMVMIAALLGFLMWNLPPAQVYMGDAGSMPLGFLIAAGTLSVTFWPSGTSGASSLAVLTPLIITAIPLFDSTVVICKRLRNRKPLFTGDRNHISHRLNRLGYSPSVSLAIVVLLQVALAGSAFTLRLGDQVAGIVALAQDAAILIAVVMLETIRTPHD